MTLTSIPTQQQLTFTQFLEQRPDEAGRYELVNGEIVRTLPTRQHEDIADFIADTLIELKTGDGIVLYTDGITEAQNRQRQQYGLQRLCKVVSQNWQGEAEAIKQSVIEDLFLFMGEQKQIDDVTLLVLKKN